MAEGEKAGSASDHDCGAEGRQATQKRAARERNEHHSAENDSSCCIGISVRAHLRAARGERADAAGTDA